MSRLSRDRLLISLEPDSVALARVTGKLRPRVISKQALDCDPTFGAESWQGALAALATALEALRSERLDATVVLSNHFVRYAIVPFDAAIASPEEALGLARFHFTKVHGERARDWNLRLSETTHGAPSLASAVDAGIIEAIRAAFPPKGGVRLISVQPYLMSAFNLWRGSIGDEDVWLLLIESRRACLALISTRNWAAVQSPRGDFLTPESWADLLDRQTLRVDTASAPRKVLVHVPAGRKPIADEMHSWKFSGLVPPPLEGFLPLEDGRLAMALTCR